MVKSKRALYKPLVKNEDGKPLCRLCNSLVVSPRRSFCSEECSHEYNIRSNMTYARFYVQKRDKGVCALCKTDTKLQMRVAKRIRDVAEYSYQRNECLHLLCDIWNVTRNRITGRHLWDMDHIVPVVDGGGGCGLDNLRTLCINCHKQRAFKNGN